MIGMMKKRIIEGVGMKKIYQVRYENAEGDAEEIEFVDVKEALNFIESGLHFVQWFQIQWVKKS